VEVHRARIMDKLGARNAADLVRIVLSERHRSAVA
jgi:FixJ family two-component response regulator